MKKADVIDEVVNQTGLRKRDVTDVVEIALEAMILALRKHEKVQLVGFGTFEPRRRKARIARNPRTQEEIRVGSTWSLVFRPGKHLRSALSGKSTS